MKKLLLTLLTLGALTAANAQQPHSILVYGNAGFDSYNDKGGNQLSWNVTPGVGYQFNHNWTVGVNLGWSQFSTKLSGATDRKSNNSIMAGAFLRHTKYIAGSQFFWICQLDAGYMGTYTTDSSAPATNKSTGIAVSITPGVGMNIGKGYALNFNIGGLGFSTTTPDGTSNHISNFNFSFGQSVNMGLSKNFKCHHMHHHKANHEPGAEMHGVDTPKDDEDAPKKKHHRHHKEKDEDKNDD